MMVNKEFEDYLLMRVHENDDSRTKDAMAYSLMVSVYVLPCCFLY